MDAIISSYEFLSGCVCGGRSKSTEQREYVHLRDALSRKQDEVRRLQQQVDALRATTDDDALYSSKSPRLGERSASVLEAYDAAGFEDDGEEFATTEDENAPPPNVARRR